MFHNQTLQQLNHKLVKEQINRDVAELHVTECHQNIATLQSKRYHLRTLLDRLEQEQQEAQEKTKAAVDSFSRLDQLVKSIELDIRFAQNQLKLYNTILYNTHADVLDACPLNKHKILAKMEKEKVHDPTSMDDFISLLYVEGYLCEDPATGGSAPTTVSEQEGETKEAVVQVDVGTDASSTLTAPPTHGETKEVTNANPTIPSVPTTIPQGETKENTNATDVNVTIAQHASTTTLTANDDVDTFICSICTIPDNEKPLIWYDERFQLECNHVYHSECLGKWVNKTTTDTALNVTCPLCRAFIDTATSEQLKKMYTHVKKKRKELEKQRNREAEAARVALVQEEQKKKKIEAAAVAAELAAQEKKEQEEQALRQVQEEKIKQDRRTKKEKKEAEKEKRRKEAKAKKARALQLKQEEKKQAALRKMEKEQLLNQKRAEAKALYMKKQQEENALREKEKEKERLMQEEKDLVEKKKRAAVAKMKQLQLEKEERLVKLKFQERLARERQERKHQAKADRLEQLEKKRVEKESRKKMKRERKEKKARAAARAARMKKTGQICVPEDCSTLKEAVKKVYEDHLLTTIVVGEGCHQIDGEYLEIPSAMYIVGDPEVPKEKIVIMGGIRFEEGVLGHPLLRKRTTEIRHLQHLIIRQSKDHGVAGRSSFTMEDVIVEQCGIHGVWAAGTGVVGRCTNVEVRQCGWSGVVASCGGSVTLIGAKTTVHHNCTKGESDLYGLLVFGSASSTIQLVSPLTKETVSMDNGGARNLGAQADPDTSNLYRTDVTLILL